MYFRSEGKSVCADVIPYYENGTFYLFYLKDFRDWENHGEGCPWCLLTTTDFVHYEDHGEVLPRGSQEDQDLYVFTGCCCKFNGEYYIFYTGHNPHKRACGLPEQKVLLAKSPDLFHWTKVTDFVLEAPNWLQIHDFRDPFVYWVEEKQCYYMLLAGRLITDGAETAKGITLRLRSVDLLNWEVEQEPFYAPNAFYTHECPDLFQMGDWWYLIFSEFSDKNITTYRMAKSPEGPWITPKINTFDGHAFYAAKSATDGQKRYLFGWNCIKNNEIDDAPWQWGGTIIPHELVQAEDGTLYVKCPQAIQDSYDGLLWEAPSCTLGSNYGKEVQLFDSLPTQCKIEMDLTAEDDIGEFAILLNADDQANSYYAAKWEPKYNRLALDRHPRRDSTVHAQVDVERYCPITSGQSNHVLIIMEGSVAEVYVNDQVAMSIRMFDLPAGRLGLYAHNTKVRFDNIRVSIQQNP